MSDTTKIEWADSTFNPWIGCTKVSRADNGGGGCDWCYAAESTPVRVLRGRGHETWGPGAPRQRTSAGYWKQPLRWNDQPFVECMACRWRGEARAAQLVENPAGFFPPVASARVCPACDEPLLKEARRRVFCASLADVFDNEVDAAWRLDLFNIIRATPNLDWLLLTKRIGNAERMITNALLGLQMIDEVTGAAGQAWPWPNVWLGATVVNQGEADRDVPKLLSTPAAKRFLSIEPMLGSVDLTELQPPGAERAWVDALRGSAATMAGTGMPYKVPRLDWVIVGGESGAHARPAHPSWFRALRNQCKSNGVPFLLKQWGEWQPCAQMSIAERHASAAKPLLDDTYVRFDGTTHTTLRDDHEPFDAGDALVRRVGKKTAGRLLDSVEHNGFPEASDA